MKRVWILCVISVLFLVFLGACGPVYKLNSGRYQMSLQTGAESNIKQAKTVVVTVQEGRVTVENPESSVLMNGQLKGNDLTLSSQDGDQVIELKGVLAADNEVKGKAVHKKGDKAIFNAGFELSPVK